MVKSKIHIFTGVCVGGGGGWQPTFDAKSKNAKVQYSHFHGGGPTFDAEAKNAKNPKIHIFTGRGSVANF